MSQVAGRLRPQFGAVRMAALRPKNVDPFNVALELRRHRHAARRRIARDLRPIIRGVEMNDKFAKIKRDRFRICERLRDKWLLSYVRK
jgi:hypothetical protein